MGGYMDWPRFRSRNRLLHRPNYYTGGPNAPAAPQDGCDECSRLHPMGKCDLWLSRNHSLDYHQQHHWQELLSGEIDRMVYGYWLNPESTCLTNIAAMVSLNRDQIEEVVRLLLLDGAECQQKDLVLP